MIRIRWAATIAVCLLVPLTAMAGSIDEESGLLEVRDQNPFVTGSGLPLVPWYFDRSGNWIVEASIAEANTQWKGSSTQKASIAPVQLVYGGETREVRVSVGYAFADDWNVRASLGDEWFGVGFLNKPIQHFHNLIGAPQGFRNGRLGARPPIARVTQGGVVLYQVDQSSQGVAPLLIDLSHTWNPSDNVRYGVSLGTKFATGDSDDLSDMGDTGISISAFGHVTVFNSLQLDGRVGVLHSSGNDILPTLARSTVPFGDVSVRGGLIGNWDWQLQYGAHGALYRNVPIYLDYAGLATAGIVRKIGARSELTFGLTEDFPIDHTQDIAFFATFRYGLNN